MFGITCNAVGPSLTPTKTDERITAGGSRAAAEPAGHRAPGICGRRRQRDRLLPAARERSGDGPDRLPGRHQLMIDWLLDSMSARGDAPALLGSDGQWSFGDIVKRSREWSHRLAPIEPGAVVTFDADYGRETIALLLALAGNRNVAVPLSPDVAAHHDAFRALSQAAYHVSGLNGVTSTGVSTSHRVLPAPAPARQAGSCPVHIGIDGCKQGSCPRSRGTARQVPDAATGVSDARVSSG